MVTKPLIQLFNLEGLGLIILNNTGINISNQTGGYSCSHPEEEGIFLPLGNMPNLVDKLTILFTGPKWRGSCCNGIDNETADLIDSLLSNTEDNFYITDDTSFIKVDRDRLQDSQEAWIYVDISEPVTDSRLKLTSGFGQTKGVLTWPNSD